MLAELARVQPNFKSILSLIAICALFDAAVANAQQLAAPVTAQHAGVPFDFSEQPGEHPLAKVVRVLESVLTHIDASVQDYTCNIKKRERLEGELGDQQLMLVKIRHQPFSVYMQFFNPHKGREVLYVAGLNDNKIIALDGGWKRRVMAPVSLDPTGMIAMRQQKYPITKIGIRNLTSGILDTAKADMQYEECEVTITPGQTVEGRKTTLIQMVHPNPKQVFRFHVARMFLDEEKGVPIHFDAYSWPAAAGGQPPLEESYTYCNLQLNVGLGAKDFDKDNPDIFR